MVTTTRMRWHSLCCTFCLQIFWSEIVLECIFISAIRVLQFLRQVLFVFHLAGQLISLLTYLGKRKLNWEKGCLFELGRSCLTVRQNISLNPTFICPHCLHSKTTLECFLRLLLKFVSYLVKSCSTQVRHWTSLLKKNFIIIFFVNTANFFRIRNYWLFLKLRLSFWNDLIPRYRRLFDSRHAQSTYGLPHPIGIALRNLMFYLLEGRFF